MENDFLNKLVHHIKSMTIEEYISYSFDKWTEYIDSLDLMDEDVISFLMSSSNKDSIAGFISDGGILNLQYSEDRILKRYFIGLDSDISIRVQNGTIFKEFFEVYQKYLTEHPVNKSLQLKLILNVISRKIKIVPQLATLDTIENDSEKVGYNICFSDDVTESLVINIRQDLSSQLVLLSNDRSCEAKKIITEEMSDLLNLMSRGLFRLIIENNYPKFLENILPEKIYIKQIEDRALKDEMAVKYDGKLYKSIKLGKSYVVVDSNIRAVEDKDIAEAIYCKINLSKSMF